MLQPVSQFASALGLTVSSYRRCGKPGDGGGPWHELTVPPAIRQVPETVVQYVPGSRSRPRSRTSIEDADEVAAPSTCTCGWLISSAFLDHTLP